MQQAMDHCSSTKLCTPPQADDSLWDTMADDLVELIAEHLKVSTLQRPWVSRPLSQVPAHYVESSVGAAHFVQLSKALGRRSQWLEQLQRNQRSYRETLSCCRVIDSQNEDYDWPLAALRLRASGMANDKKASTLSHALPLSRSTLRTAYWNVAKEVHPDRLHTPLASEAMSVLNEAYRQAVLQFSVRDTSDVIRLDALGLEHAPIH